MNKQEYDNSVFATVCRMLLKCPMDREERKFTWGAQLTAKTGGKLQFRTKQRLGQLSVKYLQNGRYMDYNWWKSKKFTMEQD